MLGSTDEVADNIISDQELLGVELLLQDRIKIVKRLLDAFFIKTELK